MCGGVVGTAIIVSKPTRCRSLVRGEVPRVLDKGVRLGQERGKVSGSQNALISQKKNLTQNFF